MVHERWDEYKEQAIELQGLVEKKFCDEFLFERFCKMFIEEDEGVVIL